MPVDGGNNLGASPHVNSLGVAKANAELMVDSRPQSWIEKFDFMHRFDVELKCRGDSLDELDEVAKMCNSWVRAQGVVKDRCDFVLSKANAQEAAGGQRQKTNPFPFAGNVTKYQRYYDDVDPKSTARFNEIPRSAKWGKSIILLVKQGYSGGGY